MPVAPSFADLLSVGQVEAQARRPDLVFGDGDVTEAMLHASAAMADLVLRYLSQAFRATWLDGAKGQELTDLVDDHLGIQRHEASPATVQLTLSRATAGAGAGSVLTGFRVGTEATADGAQIVFTLSGDAVFGAADLSVIVTAEAELAGKSGNVAAGTITKPLASMFDSTITVTNAVTAAGGAEEESDNALRERARTFWQVLVRGTIAALVYGAKQVSGVQVATVFEEDGTGLVTVRIADADGNSNLALAQAVLIELENWRAAGIFVQVESVTKQVLNLSLLLRVKTGFSVASVASLVASAVAARIDKLDVGETLYLDSVIAAAIGVDPDNILDVEISGVPADIVPTNTVVLRAGTITVAELV